jgi:hypothetical protein
MGGRCVAGLLFTTVQLNLDIVIAQAGARVAMSSDSPFNEQAVLGLLPWSSSLVMILAWASQG